MTSTDHAGSRAPFKVRAEATRAGALPDRQQGMPRRFEAIKTAPNALGLIELARRDMLGTATVSHSPNAVVVQSP